MPNALRLTPELVAKIPSTIPDPGPVADIAHLQTDEVRAHTLKNVLSTCPDPKQAWVFAFGSLMWKPEIEFSEQRRARVEGWHRSFCLGPDTRYRGNPQSPGLMLSLDRGGYCEGVVFRLNEVNLSGDLLALIVREPPIPPIWVEAQTEQGPVSALAFVSPLEGFGYVGGLSPEDTARQIAPAVGIFGSMADYVLNTVMHLEEMGIYDPMVWQMQELVAAELEQMPEVDAQEFGST